MRWLSNLGALESRLKQRDFLCCKTVQNKEKLNQKVVHGVLVAELNSSYLNEGQADEESRDLNITALLEILVV